MSMQFDSAVPDYAHAGGVYTFPGGAGRTAMTIAFWAYLDSMPPAASAMVPVSKWKSAGGENHCFCTFFVDINAQPRFLACNEDAAQAKAWAGDGAGGTMQLVADTWYHYLATANISGTTLTAQLFIDGVRRDNLAGGSNVTAANSVYLGITTDPVYLGKLILDAYPFDGRLEDVAIWDRVLSDAEISALYSGRFRANHKAFLGGLKVYWPLDNPFSGNMIGDEASVINHTPFYSTAQIIPDDGHEPSWSDETPGLIYQKRSRIIRPPWFPHGGHKIYRSQDGDVDNFVAQAFMATDAESVTIAGQDLPADTKWHYIRRAVCPHGEESPDSKPPCVIHIDDAGDAEGSAPNPPVSLSATPTAGGKIKLRWRYSCLNQIVKPTAFRVYIDSGSGFDFSTPDDTVTAPGGLDRAGGSQEINWESDALTHGTTYRFVVRSYNSTTGAETQKTNAAAAVADDTGPAAITGLTASYQEVSG